MVNRGQDLDLVMVRSGPVTNLTRTDAFLDAQLIQHSGGRIDPNLDSVDTKLVSVSVSMLAWRDGFFTLSSAFDCNARKRENQELQKRRENFLLFNNKKRKHHKKTLQVML